MLSFDFLCLFRHSHPWPFCSFITSPPRPVSILMFFFISANIFFFFLILQTKWDDVDWDPLFELLKEPRSNWNWIRTTAPYTTLVRIPSQKDYCFRMRNVGNSTHVNYLRIFLFKKNHSSLQIHVISMRRKPVSYLLFLSFQKCVLGMRQ